MRIDILTWKLSDGGAERVAANLANGWHEAGHEVRIILHEPLHTVEYQPLQGIRLVSYGGAPYKPIRALARWIRLRRALVRNRADVVVAVQANMAIEAVLASVGLGLCIVGCEHSTPERAVRGKLWRFLRPLAYRRLSAVTTLTVGAAGELQRLCSGSRVFVIPNALRLPLAENLPRIDPAEVVHRSAPVLLAAGRMIEAKGFDRLITNFASLAALKPDVRLVILGDGPLRDELVRQVDVLGLSDSVLLPGRAGNMTEWYERAKLYLMTSRWEGLPMVLLEAMAHGVPVVATDFRYGPRDVIRDGVDGRIVPENEPDAWVDAVAELLHDDRKRLSMATHAREVNERFSEGAILLIWEGLLDRLGMRR